ncbi:hypothetical protein HYC85_005437, partial [Camellia sinensis]
RAWIACVRLGRRAVCPHGAWERVQRLGLTRFIQSARESACGGFWALFLLFWTPLGDFFFLDASVGCDGSVLLDGTDGEKFAFPNQNSLRGFEVIDAIKTNVEIACPSMVSCADILTLAAREAVFLTGGPYWAIALGRRDGLTANQTAANTDLPSPFDPLENITAKFTSKGLDRNDVVVLSGAHTIGFAQCFTFKPRLFNFDGSGNPDPTLDASLLSNLQSVCPNQDNSDTNLAPLDRVSSSRFDNNYYNNLLNNSGLLESDQALMGDNRTAAMVNIYSKFPFLFSKNFGVSMVKMSYIGVLTGQNGQIRKNCRVFYHAYELSRKINQPFLLRVFPHWIVLDTRL